MNSLPGIGSYPPIISYNTNGTISPAYSLLVSELGLSTQNLFGANSTVVGISGQGQLLAAAAAFQDSVKALQIAGGSDFATLSAQAQNLVDAFNNLQDSITGINGSSLPGGNVTGASGLALSLDTQALASYANGDSTLTRLSQLGITYQPATLPGTGGNLNLDLNTLQSAFNADAAGAFSLLTGAAHAFGSVAGNFVTLGSSQFSSLAALLQTSSIANNTSPLDSLLSAGLPAQTQFDLSSILSSAGSANLGQVYVALTEYSLVSGLFA